MPFQPLPTVCSQMIQSDIEMSYDVYPPVITGHEFLRKSEDQESFFWKSATIENWYETIVCAFFSSSLKALETNTKHQADMVGDVGLCLADFA